MLLTCNRCGLVMGEAKETGNDRHAGLEALGHVLCVGCSRMGR
jgi:hypothetical protein